MRHLLTRRRRHTTSRPPAARPAWRLWLHGAGLATVLAAVVAAPTGAAPAADDDPALTQTIPAGQPVVEGEHVLATGHVDLGPRLDGGTWRFLIHDDAARAQAGAPSVWRRPEHTALVVSDAAQLTVPEDPAYAFVGEPPDTPVWVVPQTQNPDVVWLGWNTQDPEVMAVIDRGVTLSLDGVQGPGELRVYLQSGDFGAPQVLWDSGVQPGQPIWVDVNTHTHANWVFTRPGVYLVRLTASADLLDGTSVSDTQLLRFAVGGAATAQQALAASWDGESGAGAAADGAEPATGQPAGAQRAGGQGPAQPDAAADLAADARTQPGSAGGGGVAGGLPPWLLIAIGVAAVGLVAVAALTALRSARARERALGEGAAAHSTGDAGTGGTRATADRGPSSSGPADRPAAQPGSPDIRGEASQVQGDQP